MEMDWQARELGLDACSESLARTILHTPAIYRGANQGGATLIKKRAGKKVLIARHMTCCPASSASSDVDRPCRWSLPATFFRYVKNRKIQIQPNPIWLIRPSSLNFIITPNCFRFGKIDRPISIGNLASEEAIASASDGGHHDRSGRWFKTAVAKTDRKNEQVIDFCFFFFFCKFKFVIIDDEPCGNLRFRTQRYAILVCQ